MSVNFDISSNNTGVVSIDNLTGSSPAILGSQSLVLTAASGTYSGVISGSGGITINGSQWILTGANTYTGGTTVASGTLSVSGTSPTGFGNVVVSAGATLMGTGTLNGQLTVAGILKPGNSPGYLAATNTVTMSAGSTYAQDIAGTVQASSTSPVGASGYYSFLNVSSGQFVIQPGATLVPRLSNLFSANQSGYGSAIYMPALGNRLRIVTANGGISGRFSVLTQPAELAVGTQFLPFYNMAGSNSVDLAVIPTSYQTTIAAASGNANAQSVGGALTQIAQASSVGTASAAQNQLLYVISGQTSAQSIANLAQGMSGEVYAATVAVMAQTTQRTQQAVLNRLGDTAGLGLNMPMASTNMSTQVGGAPSASVSSNPSVNPRADAQSFSKGNVWGELAYQRGNRSNDSQSGGWSSNLYQLTFGSDFYSSNGTIAGAGVALSSTTINPVYGSSTIQQGSLFAYGKMPVESFVLDAMASVGLSSSDVKRGDVTGLSAGFRNNSVSGNDVMLSLGLSRPFDTESMRLTPFARVTWQMVSQSGVNEGDAVSALSVNRFTGNGVRGVIGLAAGSKANNPMTAKHTYRAYVGIGADSAGLLNPTLNASLAGINTSITTPNAGTAFVQAGLYGTAKMSENTFAYAGISGEARSGQTLGTVNVGLKVQF
jgi:autotransporter-associated beta strand protein